MKQSRSLLLYILFLLFASNSFSQEYFFRSYSIEQGLPQSSVFSAIEDQRGEMWIGTDGSGICRFNGIDFIVMDKSNGLSGNIVRSVFEDSNGNIWIGTNNGIDKYNGKNLQSFSETDISETPVLAINEDSDGNIWVGTESKGLFRITFGDSLIIENYSIADGLTNVFIFDIDIDNRNRVWLSMIGGINIIEYEPENLQITKLIEGYDIPSGFILCGNMDADNNMWFGTLDEGLFKLEVGEDLNDIKLIEPEFLDFLGEERIWDIHWTKENECFAATNEQGVVHFNHDGVLNQFTKENGIKTDQIYRVTETEKGDLWFSTLGNGILKFEEKLLVKYHEGAGINGNQIYSIISNENKEILVGSDEGFSIYNFDGDKPIEITSFNSGKGLLTNDITSITTDGDVIWLGSSEGVAKLENGRLSYPAFNKGRTGNIVNCLLNDSKGNLWIGTDEGYNIYMDGELYRITEDRGFVNNEVQTIIEAGNGDIWIGTLGGLVRMQDDIYTDFIKEDGLAELSIHALVEDKNGDIWIGTFGGGIFLFSQEYDSIPIRKIADKEILSSNNIYSMAFISDSILIATTESGFEEITIGSDNELIQSVHYDVNDGYPGGGNNLNAILVDDKSKVWFGNSEGLVRFDPSIETSLLIPPQIEITNIKLFFEAQDWAQRFSTQPWFNLPENLVLPHNENHLTIGFSCIYYGNHNDLTYSYFLEGQSKDWSPYLTSREVDFPGLRPGKYDFMVRAKNKYGVVGEITSFEFITIRPPFWMQPWFIALAIIVLIVSVVIIIRMRTEKLKQEKIQLEKIVEERTREVVEQKDEIERQHDIVVAQNTEIEASIHYAERIQKAVIPSQDTLKKNFLESFIIFRPQHIVSGDFYWIGQKGDYLVFTAADCTGHGVPGAFMSMLGISYLNQIVLEENTVNPGEILDKLRNHIINSFKQREQDIEDRKDGMDISLCSFNLKTNKLLYAGAYNSLFIIKEENGEAELHEIDADKMPVGLYARMDSFNTSEVDYKKGDTIYLYSDGYPDQFGGPKYKKFLKKKFKNMLLENYKKPMVEQEELYTDTIVDWMSYKDPDGEDIIQTDDILVIGIRL